ncbi:MAG TPA: IS110 family transposase [Thermodesulfobacteriota bacterium]|nr:IS110 family transposase [Thermodesulfobacteriota bacterium]
MNEVDHTRLKEFRQLKKEIRGSKEFLIVGIDVAKEKHYAFFGTAAGKTLLRRLIFENTIEGFERLQDQVRAIKEPQGLSKVIFGLEPTANYHKPLGEHLIKCGEMVVLVSGVAIKHNRKSLDGRWDRNDTRDAANIADLISQGKCQFYEYPEMWLRDLRSLLSLKRKLKKQEHSYRVRIRNQLLAQYFPELDRYSDRPEVEAIVRWSLDPSRIAGLEKDQFMDLVTTGRKSQALHRRLQGIQELAVASIGCEMGEGAAFEAKVMVEGLRQIRKAIKSTDVQIKEICRQFPEYGYLLTIPGFGPDVSAKVIGALGDPFRFQNRKQVLKMAGLDLSADRSGKTADMATPVISKKGKADLRYALYQAAFIASTRYRPWIEQFTDQLQGRTKEAGIKTKRWVKLSAKLLIIAWTIMKKKEPYNPQYLNPT